MVRTTFPIGKTNRFSFFTFFSGACAITDSSLHFGIISDAFWYIFFIYFWYKFWDAFLNATFPTFVPKWLPKWSDQKALRKLLGAPRPQRRPKGLSKTNRAPRAFLNRMPDGGLDAPSMAPGSSRASVLEHFHMISRMISNHFYSRTSRTVSNLRTYYFELDFTSNLSDDRLSTDGFQFSDILIRSRFHIEFKRLSSVGATMPPTPTFRGGHFKTEDKRGG